MRRKTTARTFCPTHTVWQQPTTGEYTAHWNSSSTSVTSSATTSGSASLEQRELSGSGSTELDTQVRCTLQRIIYVVIVHHMPMNAERDIVLPIFCLSVCLSVCLSIYQSVRLPVCLSVCMSVCLSVRLSVCLSVCSTVRPSVCLSVCLSV